jgi:hypothetical protein
MSRHSTASLLCVLLLAGAVPAQSQDKPSITIPGVDRKIPLDTKELDLTFYRVTVTGLKELKELKQLTILNLSHADVANEGLKELKGTQTTHPAQH